MTTPAQPQFLQPATPGLLSNTRGSNTGGDALTFKTRYSNPAASGNPAGQMRMLATRTGSAASGPAFTPQVAWDSGWVGAPTVNALPTALRQAGVAEINNRVYVTGGLDSSNVAHAEVWSAPLNGGSVGTWRQERPMSYFWTAGATTGFPSPRYGHGCCIATFGASGGTGSAGAGVGGTTWLICIGGITSVANDLSTTGIAATINADGTLGPWVTLFILNPGLAFCNLIAYPNQYASAGLVLTGGAVNSSYGTIATNFYVTVVRGAPANSASWDIPGGWFTALPNYLSGSAGHVVVADWANNCLILLRGSNGTTSQSGCYYLKFSIDTVNWVTQGVGPGWISMTGGAAFQNDAACVYFGAPYNGARGGSPQSYVYIIGGTSGAALPPPIGSAVSTVTIGTITWDTGNNPSVVWSTSAHPLPAALSGLRAVVASHNANPLLANGQGPFPDANLARVSVFGGGSGTTSSASVRSNSIATDGSGDLTGSWVTGVGAGLQTTDLGTGGAIALSSDPTAPASSQDVTVNYNGPGAAAPVSAFTDGDRVQLQTWFTDKSGGDVSSPAYSTLLIGQPPTLGAIAPSGTISNGQPTASFTFTSGPGGSGEYSYRIQVKQGASTLFDTGTRYDNANNALLTIAPLLPPSTTFTNGLIITATSKDTPLPGSSNTVTSTTSFSTSGFALPATPSLITVTPSAAVANVALAWGAASGATAYNVYYRRSASSIWLLYSQPGNVTSTTVMDHIALGVSYDFAVSATNATPAESALSSFQSATIPLGSYSAFLHIAGQTAGVPFQVQGSPVITKKRPFLDQLGFNSLAPLRRYATANYHSVKGKALLLDATPASLRAMQSVIATAENGNPLFYRDALGGQLVMTLDADQSVTIVPPWNREVSLALTETLNTIGPYVAAGSARGYLTLTGGSRPPLSSEESLL